MSLVFVSEAASKADLYFLCKGGQIYCAGCLVIYGAGRAPRSLPCLPAQPAPDRRQQGRLQLCSLLAGLRVAWEWHWALAALLALTNQPLLP